MQKNVFEPPNSQPKNQVMINRPTSLPYPEEAPDFNLSITNEQLLQNFFTKYSIPERQWDFWKLVTIKVDKTLSNPAVMISETKTLLLRPEYSNPGILAHEFSHLSYSCLVEDQKTWFTDDYNAALKIDGLLQFLHSNKAYMNTSIIEAHAEIFRYLGNQMPASLKAYYPHLLF